MTQHTPGPWTTSAPASYRINTAGDIYIVQHVPEHIGAASVSLGEKTANARLIAAAPDLLAALNYIASIASDYAKGQQMHGDDVREILGTARTAIARAEGKTDE